MYDSLDICMYVAHFLIILSCLNEIYVFQQPVSFPQLQKITEIKFNLFDKLFHLFIQFSCKSCIDSNFYVL